jgi:hypothetical protein
MLKGTAAPAPGTARGACWQGGTMLSPTCADAQFQLRAEYPGNLDRCRRCGNPRLLHAADGRCALAFPVRRARTRLLATVAGVLAALGVATWLLVNTATPGISSAAAFVVLISIILLAGGAAVTERRR